jgi:hypothetical protein
MKRLFGFAIVLISLFMAFFPGITFGENTNVSKENVSDAQVNISSNATLNVTELNNVTTDLENATGLLNNTNATDPFANTRGKTPSAPPSEP